jgi:hypothetical protein
LSDPPADGTADQQAWADVVVAHLDASEDIDRSLVVALHGNASLHEENALRRADALRGAALGLTAAGCAAAAGISEKLLLTWRARDAPFDAAMTAAQTLARTHALTPGGPITPAGLRLLLRAVGDGSPLGSAAALLGVRSDSLWRLRRANPRVGALVNAALRRGHSKAGRGKKGRGLKGYRLVRLDTPPPPPDPDNG